MRKYVFYLYCFIYRTRDIFRFTETLKIKENEAKHIILYMLCIQYATDVTVFQYVNVEDLHACSCMHEYV